MDDINIDKIKYMFMDIASSDSDVVVGTIERSAKRSKFLLFIFSVVKAKRTFYCQREIEFESKCKEQCDHCKEYYAPLERQ